MKMIKLFCSLCAVLMLTSCMANTFPTLSEPTAPTETFVATTFPYEEMLAIFEGPYTELPRSYPCTDRLPDHLKGCRSMLTEQEKELYDMFLPYFLSYTPFKLDLSHIEPYANEELFHALRAIMMDYPESWLCFNYGHSDLHQGEFSSFSGQFYNLDFFLMNKEPFDVFLVQDYFDSVHAACDDIIAEMPKKLTTKQKYKWLADRLCEITEYDHAHEKENLYADGPLLRGKGICQSYAYAYQWLCQRAGLWCITCSGYGAGEGHCWNVIMLDDGTTYYMDLTWEDSSKAKNGYYYFMTYETCIATGHTIDKGEWIATGK